MLANRHEFQTCEREPRRWTAQPVSAVDHRLVRGNGFTREGDWDSKMPAVPPRTLRTPPPPMAIKVVIARHVTPEKVEQLKPLVIQLRTMAMAQPGYISGETLVNLADPAEYLVISTWSALENWNRWQADPRRMAVQAEIDHLLGAKTVYQLYCHG